MYMTIYHPRFEPDENWLRAMLLFYDTVHSIVPDGAGYKASPGVARLQDKAPEAFIPLQPNIEDRAVFSAEDGVWNRYFTLTAFLDELGNEGVSAERISAPFYVEGGVVHLTLNRAVAVHYDKLGQAFIDELIARKLAIEVEGLSILLPAGPARCLGGSTSTIGSPPSACRYWRSACGNVVRKSSIRAATKRSASVLR
jgi:hypothetical protein